MKREKLLILRALIEKGATSLSDEDALEGVELFPAWKVDMAYALNDRIRYEDKLYRCVQAHTSQAEWIPPVTPALWTEVAEPGTIPVWKKPTGAQDAYNKGDKVHYPGKDDPVYESLIDANVYSPDEYPAGWKQL